MHVLLVTALSLLCLASQAQSTVLKVAAFNIQVFGPTKGSKPEVMETIRKIVSAYDVILVQEIRDKSGDVITDLFDLLNSISSETFAYKASVRLGRTSSKEQYVYYYKVNKLTVLDEHLFDDSADDVFEREPYGILIEVAKSTGTMKMALTGVHIKPSDAVSEIIAMETAYDEFKSVFGTENMLIMGDMNADCSYVSSLKLQETGLFSDVNTYWSLITSDKDTTTYASNCAYDRILATGTELQNHVFKSGIEHFETEFELSEEEMKAVSDHYPVWVEITLD